MTYELWNTEARNIVGAYATETEALVLVLEAMDEHGADYVNPLALIVDDGDEVKTLAIGAELASRARSAIAGASLSR